ncbi:MAG: serine/threonine-protein phosphatase [Anaerolineae bacterium]|nr:serine/threonine-protein phosphatase [Anaerolineae bacterium]
MNIIRRLLGHKVPPSSTSQEAQPELAEESAEPQTISIPGVGTEITVETPSDTAALGVTRQLPNLETALSRPNQHIAYGHGTDVGQVRTNNQDAILTFFASQGNADSIPDFGLFIVADGMGGHHHGEKAATIATQILAEQVTRQIFLPMLTPRYEEIYSGPSFLTEILTKAVRASSDIVSKHVPEGGTTVTAAVVIGDLVHIVHVGDSRAYLITREYGIEQITRDHSLVQRLIELDQLTPEEAALHPQKNVLYRAIGQSDNLEVDAVTRRLPADSYLLLCSDGLWNTVPETVVHRIILDSETPQHACDRLIATANEHGGPDNISVILLHAPG